MENIPHTIKGVTSQYPIDFSSIYMPRSIIQFQKSQNVNGNFMVSHTQKKPAHIDGNFDKFRLLSKSKPSR